MTPAPEGRTPLPLGFSWEKAAIWLLFAALVYAIQPVFEILFMTYIMSYVADRAVVFLTGSATAARPGFRKVVILIVYLATLGLGFLVAQSVVPRAIAQGKWLLGQLSDLNLERMREDLLARTLGRMEFTRFRHTPPYEKAFKDFVELTSRTGGFEQAKKLDRQVREAFEQELFDQEGQKALEQLRRTGDLDDLYRQWLRTNRAPTELAANSDLRKRLSDEYDASFRVVNGETAFLSAKETPAYVEKRQVANLDRMTTQLASAGRDREIAERAIGKAHAQENLRALTPAAREERFRAFVQTDAPRRFSDFHLTYERLLELEGIKTEAEFREKFKDESTDPKALEEQFQSWMELKLAKESRLASLFGDAAQMGRDNLPRITGWLTNIVNNLLVFGFDAFVSLMFSFMIVWEIPRVGGALERIRGTRAEWLYNEIAPEMQRLGVVIATAFSAQFMIASIDACLIFAALSWLGVPSPVFLSLIALVCCLIPYVGIIIAAPPILFVALQHDAGIAGRAALALFLIHELDAWILSPAILGEFLRLSPMMVIFVLFISQPIFGMWGLLLGVPVAVFLINDVMLRPVAASVREDLLGPGGQPR